MSQIPDPRVFAAPLAELEQRLASASAAGETLPPEALEMLEQLRTLNAALADLAASLAEDPPKDEGGSQ